MRPNFIGKLVQKMHFYYSVMISEPDIKFQLVYLFPQSQLQCDTSPRHRLEIIGLKVGYRDFQLRDVTQ